MRVDSSNFNLLRTRNPGSAVTGSHPRGCRALQPRNGYSPRCRRYLLPGMLILDLVLVLKDSLRTFFKSLSWSLGSGPCPCPGPWGSGPCPCGSGPCPYPGPCGLVLVLVFSPCKDLFPLFHYSDLFAYYCSVNAYN